MQVSFDSLELLVRRAVAGRADPAPL